MANLIRSLLASLKHRRRSSPSWAAVAIFSAILAGPAAAQSVETERDLRSRQPEDAQKDFSLTLGVPLLRTTSILATNSDGFTVDRPDWHYLPEVKLQWAHQYDGIKLTAYGVLDTDRYFEVKEADTITLEGGALLEFTDGKSDVFVPYISYTGRSYFDGDFDSLDDTRHDFAAGIFSGWGMRQGQAIAYGDATSPGDQSLSVDIYGGRREANKDFRQNTFAGITVSYSYTLSAGLWLEVTPKIKFRWYEDFFDGSRRDVRLSVLTKLVWEPDWLTRCLPNSQLSLSAEYFNNTSTDELSEYSLWEIGPELRLTTRF